jgi:hypothetical protein
MDVRLEHLLESGVLFTPLGRWLTARSIDTTTIIPPEEPVPLQSAITMSR